MAFKVIVDSNNLRVVIDTDSLSPISTFQNFKSVLTFTDLEGVLQFTDLEAANVFIDSDTKNLYFSAQYNSPNAETFSFTDSEAFALGLAKADAPTIAEELAKAMGVSLADTPTLSENLTKVMVFNRSLADSQSLTDSPALRPELVKDDSTTVLEELAKLVGSSQSDSLSFADSEVRNVGKAVDDGAANDQTFAVTVVSTGSGNKYAIDGVQQATLNLKIGATYTFDQSNSSNSNHPLRFSITSNGTHAGGSEYTTNVTTNGTPGSSGAYTRIQVTGSTPSTLYYYCTNHSAMGGQANAVAAGDFNMLEAFSRVVTFARTFTDGASLDDVASASDDLATQSGINKNNIFSFTDVQAFSVGKAGVTDSFDVSESLSYNLARAIADSFSLSDSPSISTSTTDPFSDDPSISESLAYSFGTSVSDSATISESVSILFVPGGGSLLNTGALNTFVLN
jgi:hypothetical protein